MIKAKNLFHPFGVKDNWINNFATIISALRAYHTNAEGREIIIKNLRA